MLIGHLLMEDEIQLNGAIPLAMMTADSAVSVLKIDGSEIDEMWRAEDLAYGFGTDSWEYAIRDGALVNPNTDVPDDAPMSDVDDRAFYLASDGTLHCADRDTIWVYARVEQWEYDAESKKIIMGP